MLAKVVALLRRSAQMEAKQRLRSNPRNWVMKTDAELFLERRSDMWESYYSWKNPSPSFELDGGLPASGYIPAPKLSDNRKRQLERQNIIATERIYLNRARDLRRAMWISSADYVQACQLAEELLHSVLTTKQLEDKRARGYFEVQASGGNVYRIYTAADHQNVVRLDSSGKEVERLCGYHPDSPPACTHVAQLLALATNENLLRDSSNKLSMVMPDVDEDSLTTEDELAGWT